MRMTCKIKHFPAFKKAKPHFPSLEEKRALRFGGKGAQIGRILFLRGTVTLGPEVVIKDYCSIDGVIKIGSGTILEEGTILQQRAILGKNCHIHKGAALTSGSHSIVYATLHPQLLYELGAFPLKNKIKDKLEKLGMALRIKREPLIIGDDVTVGEYSVVLAGVRIGRGAKILCDSVVTKTVFPDTTVGGCPAKIVSSRFSEEMFLSKRIHQFKTLNPVANADDPESQQYAVFGKCDLLAQGICVNQINDKKVIFGNDIWVGMNAILDSGIKIGDGAVIGAGAHVTKDVEPYSIVVGSPARHLKWRFNEEVRNWLLRIRWWDWSEERLLERKELFTGDLTNPCEFKKILQKNYS